MHTAAECYQVRNVGQARSGSTEEYKSYTRTGRQLPGSPKHGKRQLYIAQVVTLLTRSMVVAVRPFVSPLRPFVSTRRPSLSRPRPAASRISCHAAGTKLLPSCMYSTSEAHIQTGTSRHVLASGLPTLDRSSWTVHCWECVEPLTGQKDMPLAC